MFLAFLLSACDVAEDIYWEISDTVEEVTKENDWEKNNSEEVDLDDEISPAPSLEEPVVEESQAESHPQMGISTVNGIYGQVKKLSFVEPTSGSL